MDSDTRRAGKGATSIKLIVAGLAILALPWLLCLLAAMSSSSAVHLDGGGGWIFWLLTIGYALFAPAAIAAAVVAFVLLRRRASGAGWVLAALAGLQLLWGLPVWFSWAL